MRRTTRALLLATLSSLVGAASTLVPSVAHAEGKLGEPNQVIISAERLFGLSFWSDKTDNTGGTTSTQSGTTVSFGVASIGLLDYTPYTTARVAADFVPTNGLTLGGSFGIMSATSSRDPGTGQSTDGPTYTILEVTPHVGYILPLTDSIYFWPRAGVTYFHLSSSSTSTTGTTSFTSSSSYNAFAANLEPSLVFSPAPHFGILLSGVADIPLSGTLHQESSMGTPQPDRTEKFTNFGAMLGLLGYF